MGITNMLFYSCSTPNPSPLSEREIEGLINKHSVMAKATVSYIMHDWEEYKKEGKENGESVYEQIVRNLNHYHEDSDYKEESPIRHILRTMRTFLTKIDYSHGFYDDKRFKEVANNMDFESFANWRKIKITSIDLFPKISDAYLVKYIISNGGGYFPYKGHILFKMSNTDELPYVIDFDNNEHFLMEEMRDIFNIAPYEVIIAYFNYNDIYPSGNLDDLIFNPKNIWGLKKEDVEKKLEKFKTGEYYGYCSDQEKALEESKREKELMDKLGKSFLDFFDDFTKDRESQIDLINNILIVRDIYMGDEGEVVTELKDINKVSLKKNWKFIEKDYFIENDNIDEKYCGGWNKEDENIIIYARSICETGFVETLVFKKVNEKWCLFEYTCHNF